MLNPTGGFTYFRAIPLRVLTEGKRKVLKSVLLPMLFVAALWLVKAAEVGLGIRLDEWGVFPRTLPGLKGIITSPFIHGDWQHLFSNSVPMIVLGTLLIYFYEEMWLRAFLWIYLLSGFWLWLSGREAYHIGASGIVYGLSAFLFFSGIIRRHTGLMAVSLVVVFLYGGLVWGIFPLFVRMSWEAHLSGLMAGTLMAFYFRKEGTQRKVYEWDDEGESSDDPGQTITGEPHETVIRYLYKPEDKNDDEKN
jgi:membrane associated rhomboid family serine protease